MVKSSNRMVQAQRSDARTRWIVLLCFSVGSFLLLTQINERWQERQTPQASDSEYVRPALEYSNHLSLQAFGSQAVSRAFPQQTTRLVVDLSDRQVYVYQNDVSVASYPVAIGQAGWETPTGDFSVMYMQEYPTWRHPITGEWVPPGQDNPLGTRWIGFWSDGLHQIGFHGTNQSGSIGQAVSHGCIRMYNEDIQDLFQQVTLGTPVLVQS